MSRTKRPVVYDVGYSAGRKPSNDRYGYGQLDPNYDTWTYNGKVTKPVQRPVGEFQGLVQGVLFDDPAAFADAAKTWRKPTPTGKTKWVKGVAKPVMEGPDVKSVWTRDPLTNTKPHTPIRLDKVETEWLGKRVRLFHSGPRTGTVWARGWAANALWVLLDPEFRVGPPNYQGSSDWFFVAAIEDLTKIDDTQEALV